MSSQRACGGLNFTTVGHPSVPVSESVRHSACKTLAFAGIRVEHSRD